jgi:hypothetical protein
MTKEPIAKIVKVDAVSEIGAPVSIPAIKIDHVHGINNNHVPTGFCNLISSAYGIHFSGSFET